MGEKKNEKQRFMEKCAYDFRGERKLLYLLLLITCQIGHHLLFSKAQ